MDKLSDFSLLGKKKLLSVCDCYAIYKKRRSAVNAMADGSRRSLNLLECWTQSVTNVQCILKFFFGGCETSHMACNSTGY